MGAEILLGLPLRKISFLVATLPSSYGPVSLLPFINELQNAAYILPL